MYVYCLTDRIANIIICLSIRIYRTLLVLRDPMRQRLRLGTTNSTSNLGIETWLHYYGHDDVTKRKLFPRYWSFVRGIHRSPVNSPHKGQWRGALMFSLICAWINGWVNNREAGDLRRQRAHYDVIIMALIQLYLIVTQTSVIRYYIRESGDRQIIKSSV